MREFDASILMFTALMVVATISLILVGESRADVYLAISILIYFIYTFIDTRIRNRSNLKILDIVFVIVFTLIVAYRLALTLGFI